MFALGRSVRMGCEECLWSLSNVAQICMWEAARPQSSNLAINDASFQRVEGRSEQIKRQISVSEGGLHTVVLLCLVVGCFIAVDMVCSLYLSVEYCAARATGRSQPKVKITVSPKQKIFDKTENVKCSTCTCTLFSSLDPTNQFIHPTTIGSEPTLTFDWRISCDCATRAVQLLCAWGGGRG